MASDTRNGPKRIRLMLVDDHTVFRIGLSSLFRTVSTVNVVAEAGTVQQAVALARHTAPDVVLMDVRLPDGDGMDACRAILRARPETRILMLSGYTDDDAVVASIQSGAAGYLLKGIEPEQLIEAVERVASGASLLDPQVTETALEFMRRGGRPDAQHPFAALSDQQRRIAVLIADGKTNRQIAAELSLSPHTIKTYVSSMLHKLRLSRRSQIAALMVRRRGDS